MNVIVNPKYIPGKFLVLLWVSNYWRIYFYEERNERESPVL